MFLMLSVVIPRRHQGKRESRSEVEVADEDAGEDEMWHMEVQAQFICALEAPGPGLPKIH